MECFRNGPKSADANEALRHARGTGHAATLIYALSLTSFSPLLCGNYATANAQLGEAVAVALFCGNFLTGC